MRLVERVVFGEVGQYGLDRSGFLDAGHDPHRAAAVDAGRHVDVEHALEALRLGTPQDVCPLGPWKHAGPAGFVMYCHNRCGS